MIEMCLSAVTTERTTAIGRAKQWLPKESAVQDMSKSVIVKVEPCFTA